MNPVGFSLCSSKYHWRMRSGAGSAHLQRLLRDLRVARTCGRMAARTALVCLCAFFALFPSPRGSPTTGSRRTNQDRCAVKVQAGADGSRRLAVTFKTDNCSLNYPLGKHVIHEVSNISFIHLACEDQAAVVVHWSASPLGIEHVRGFRVYLEDKNPEGKQCQHLVLKDPRQLNYSYRNTMSSQPFSGLTFDTDYMVRVVPFPSLMNESYFAPSFLRTNSCEFLLGSENLVCKPFWKPKTLNVSQLGSNLHVVFDQAPPSFGFSFYFLYFKLRHSSLLRLQRCKPDSNQVRTTCFLQDVTPGTYTIELRDDSNTSRRQTQYHVSQVHSPWAGPIRAMAITVPLVIMSAFATLFTVMCRKKQQENIYSHLDEESSESSNQSAALNSERPWPRPKVFICYSSRDCSKHTSVIQSFAYFLQDFCGCEVVLDLWEHLEMCKEGQMSWLSRQLDEANFIITVCSKGLRYYVEKKSRKGKTPVCRRGNSSSSPVGGSHGDLFIAAVAMIAEKLRQVKQSEESGDQDLNRYMTVYFDYSAESDIPTMLSLAPRLKMMDQLPQLISRLHSSQAGLPDHDPLPLNVSRRNYFRSKSGRSLYVSICNMHQLISQNPDWFEAQLAPAARSSSEVSSKQAGPAPPSGPSSSPKPGCSSSLPPEKMLNSGLILNEVAVRVPLLERVDGVPKRSELLLAPSISPSPSPGPCPSPEASHCSSSGSINQRSGLPAEESCCSSFASAPPISQDEGCTVPSLVEEDHHSALEAPPPRDSGIYESSVPSSELSIPQMEGLSHDQADCSSLADSESSSSGLGDEELPAVALLHCSTGTVCKAELHHHHHPHHHHLEQNDTLTRAASL
ncbi:interleukin-17 receptor D isoform X2 [Oryzias melastigma]|uniref:interleukin-17 receptor D isoform X2 n=1 Tax=Oryzias melastigma TaxID=30732 RepID=UPI00168D11E9|nr:interleukin-17 receptor D isoform X2 [Oryzias melastigma]